MGNADRPVERQRHVERQRPAVHDADAVAIRLPPHRHGRAGQERNRRAAGDGTSEAGDGVHPPPDPGGDVLDKPSESPILKAHEGREPR